MLEVPIQVTDRGQKYCIFLYPSNGPAAAAAFAAARRLVEPEGAKAVYYAPAPLPDAAAGQPCGPFQTRYIAGYGQPAAAGKYAMWWASPDDPDFQKSATFSLIDSFYRSCDGIETLVLMDVLQAIGHGRGRTALPETSVQIPIYGPEERLVIFGASPKGLRFFFPVESTPPRYRDQFWKHLAAWAQRFKTHAQAAGAQLDPDSHRHGMSWWSGVIPMLNKMDLNSPMEMFGPLIIAPPERR